MTDDYVGLLAYSKCGRDRKRLFAVVGVRDTDTVLIADGRLRRLDRPKPKRLKHLCFTGARIGIPDSDEALNRRIAEYEFEARRDYSAEG